MNAQEMWECYCAAADITDTYEAWAFGDSPDELAQLVLQGIKTATASAYIWYSLEDLALPQAGEYSVILDVHENAVCIIRTTKVFVMPFDQVDERQAWKEGEGDRSLAYWRSVHEAFFSKELKEAGLSFDKNMDVVCEEFVRVYP